MKKTSSATGATPRVLPKPEVDGLIPVGGENHTYIVPADLADKPLVVIIPDWGGDLPTDQIKHEMNVFWDDTSFHRITFSAAYTIDDLKATLPVAKMTDGDHTLSYLITIGADPGQASQQINLRVDKKAPEIPAGSVLIFDVPTITTQYLTDNGNKVPVTVPVYTSMATADVITLTWDTTEDEDHDAGVSHTVAPGEVGSPIVVDIPGAMVIASGDGPRLARFVVTDSFNNPSLPSEYTNVDVDLDQEAQMPLPEFHDADFVNLTTGLLQPRVVHDNEGLEVLIPEWANLPPPGVSEKLILYWAKGHDPVTADWIKALEVIVTDPVPVTGFPIVMVLDPIHLQPDGPMLVRYYHKGWNVGDDEGSYSLAVPLIVDTTPPWEGRMPGAPGLPDVDITDDYLEQNEPNGAPWTLPAYADFQVGDKVYFWWLNHLPADPSELPYEEAVVTTVPMPLHVPRALVEEVGDGGCVLIYVLEDEAGNRSGTSEYTRARVALGALPANLLAPLMPQVTPEKDWIGLEDAAEGVEIAIPEFDNWKSTDEVWITWGSTTHQPQPIGTPPGFPLYYGISWETLQREYGAATGDVEITFSYRIRRGDVVFPSPPATVNLNLSLPGPVYPELPDPVNPALALAVVRGATSGVDNELRPEDNNQDADLEFVMYAPVIADEIIDFYWGPTLVEEARYKVAGTEQPGDLIEVKIPWAIIEAGQNNDDLKVHYRIGHPDSPNEQRSGMTSVDVNAIIITPDAPTFPDAILIGDKLMLNCGSLVDNNDHLRVEVPDLSAYLKEGDSITLTWTPYRGMEKEEPIPDAVQTETWNLAPGEVTGFIWKVGPYAEKILPTYDPDGEGPTGTAEIQYAFTFDGNQVTSKITTSWVGMYYGNNSCPI